MIKLLRHPKPAFLSAEKVAELTSNHKAGIKSVWNVDEIKNPLLLSSHYKCAYCECNIVEESKYMEVEHFECKSIYPDRVVDWDNLLPSCKRCNGNKHSHDVRVQPIVNPYFDNPVMHFSIKVYRFSGRTEKGKITIGVIDLNNSERAVRPRFDIGETIAELVISISEKFELYCKTKSVAKRNNLIGAVEATLIECQPNAEYAATSATLLLGNDDFIDMIQQMKTVQLWSDELEALYQTASLLVL